MAKQFVEVDILAEWDTETQEMALRCRTPTRKEMRVLGARTEAPTGLEELNLDRLKAEIEAVLREPVT